MKLSSAIFCDIDGTIYDGKRIISKTNIEFVKEATEKKVHFIIATGNGLFKQVKKVGGILNAEYAIVSNGAGVYDLINEKYIYTKKIPHEELVILCQIAEKYKINFQFWDENMVYCSKWTTPKIISLIEGVMGAPSKIFDGKVKDDAFKFEFYDNEELIDKVEIELKNHNFEYAKMTSRHIEITNAGVSKASAVAWICEHLAIDPLNSMAIGDSANDVNMLKFVNYSYAMDNGSDLVKSVSKYYAADVNQDGLAYAIEDFLYRIKA